MKKFRLNLNQAWLNINALFQRNPQPVQPIPLNPQPLQPVHGGDGPVLLPPDNKRRMTEVEAQFLANGQAPPGWTHAQAGTTFHGSRSRTDDQDPPRGRRMSRPAREISSSTWSASIHTFGLASPSGAASFTHIDGCVSKDIADADGGDRTFGVKEGEEIDHDSGYGTASPDGSPRATPATVATSDYQEGVASVVESVDPLETTATANELSPTTTDESLGDSSKHSPSTVDLSGHQAVVTDSIDPIDPRQTADTSYRHSPTTTATALDDFTTPRTVYEELTQGPATGADDDAEMAHASGTPTFREDIFSNNAPDTPGTSTTSDVASIQEPRPRESSVVERGVIMSSLLPGGMVRHGRDVSYPHNKWMGGNPN